MKFKPKYLLVAAMFAAALLPQAALADSLTFILSSPIQSVTASGGTLSFVGTIAAASTNTGSEYLSEDTFSYNGPGSLSDTAYFINTPLFLTPGQSVTAVIFQILFGRNAAAGVYPGTFTILGGNTASALNTLATAQFQANVTAPAAAVTPEPSSLLLLGTGLLGALGVVRRRLHF